MLGVDLSEAVRLIALAGFPDPIILFPNKPRWRVGDIDAWVKRTLM